VQNVENPTVRLSGKAIQAGVSIVRSDRFLIFLIKNINSDSFEIAVYGTGL
jgi:hypothetical protein